MFLWVIKLAVIGMGMTAIDAATQAKRLGAKEVTIDLQEELKLKSLVRMLNLNIARLDGCKIAWLAAPKEVKGEMGKVNGLVCSIMKLGEPDASGRYAPRLIPAKHLFLEVDMIIKAAGQTPFEELVMSNNLNNRNGKIVIDQEGATNINGIFAGGDCVNGGKEVVDAVQAGKDGAKAILEYVETGPTVPTFSKGEGHLNKC